MSQIDEPDDLPEGWSVTPFVDCIVQAVGGDWGKPVNEKPVGWVDVHVVRGTEFRNWDKEKGETTAHRCIKPSSLSTRNLSEGDLVIEISGGGPEQPVGRSLLIDSESLAKHAYPLICSNFCRKVRLSPQVDARFVNYSLKHLYGRGEFNRFQNQTVNLRNLQFTDFIEQTLLPLPPLAEQKRIVEKVQTLLARVNAARQRLAKVPTLLKRLRQAVLTSELENSSRVSFGDVIAELKYGTATKCEYGGGGTPVLRIPNIGNGTVSHDDLKYGSLEIGEQRSLALIPGDILMIRSNGSVSLIGKPALVQEAEAGFAYAGYLIRIRLDQSRAVPAYVAKVMESRDIREQIEVPARSTSGVHNINTSEIRALTIPLPPLTEQHEIVRRVEAPFARADRIEQRLAAAMRRVESLTQAILAQAFRGELVPTEAELARREGRDYEPAAVLLERIRASRPTEPTGTRKKRGPNSANQPKRGRSRT